MVTTRRLRLRDTYERKAVALTTPLLLRLLEFAREEADDDKVLHEIAERIEEKGGTLGIDDYDALVPEAKD